MTARRTTRDDNEVRVAAVLGNVFFHPGNRLFYVDNLGGVGIPGRQPVINRYADPAQFHHSVQSGCACSDLWPTIHAPP